MYTSTLPKVEIGDMIRLVATGASCNLAFDGIQARVEAIDGPDLWIYVIAGQRINPGKQHLQCGGVYWSYRLDDWDI